MASVKVCFTAWGPYLSGSVEWKALYEMSS